MRKVEYLRALADRTWDTIVVDVPDIREDSADGVDFLASDDDIDRNLLSYANEVLTRDGAHKDIVLFAVYNNDVSSSSWEVK